MVVYFRAIYETPTVTQLTEILFGFLGFSVGTLFLVSADFLTSKREFSQIPRRL